LLNIYALGSDTGNYLSTMNILFESQKIGELLRPPLIGIFLKIFCILFGNLKGTIILAVLSSVIIGIPIYLICNLFLKKEYSLILSLIFTNSTMYAEVLVWGFLTLLSLFFVLISLYFLFLITRKSNKRNIILYSISSSIVCGLNQVAFVILILLTSIYTIFYLMTNFDYKLEIKKLIPVFLLTFLLCIPYIPIYLKMINLYNSVFPGSIIYSYPKIIETINNIMIKYMFRDNPFLWVSLFLLSFLGGFYIYSKNKNLFYLYITFYLILIFIFDSSILGERIKFYIYVPIFIGIGGILGNLDKIISHKNKKIKIIVLFMSILLLINQIDVYHNSKFVDSLNWYNYLDSDVIEISNLLYNNNSNSVTSNVSLGWYFEGLSNSNALILMNRDTRTPWKIEQEESYLVDLIYTRPIGIENNYIIASFSDLENISGNPLILINEYLFVQTLIFDDNSTYIYYKQKYNLNDFNKNIRVKNINNTYFVLTEYESSEISFIKEVYLDNNNVIVNYKFPHSIESFDITIKIPDENTIEKISSNNDSLEYNLKYKNGYNYYSCKNIIKLQSDGNLSINTINNILNFNASNCTNLKLIISYHSVNEIKIKDVNYYNIGDMLHKNDIDYIIIEKKPKYKSYTPDFSESRLTWFEKTKLMEKMFEIGDIVVYRPNTELLEIYSLN